MFPASRPTAPRPTSAPVQEWRRNSALTRKPSLVLTSGRSFVRPSPLQRRSLQQAQPSSAFVPVPSLTDAEKDSVMAAWNHVVIRDGRSTVSTTETLRTLFHWLHVHLLPEVEEFAMQAFRDRGAAPLEYDHFEELILQCKLRHEAALRQNPLLTDDLLDAYVALGGQWDTKGALDNAKMRQTIRQYDLRIDFDRFLRMVDQDGNEEVDFDEFRKLVEEEQYLASREGVGSPQSDGGADGDGYRSFREHSHGSGVYSEPSNFAATATVHPLSGVAGSGHRDSTASQRVEPTPSAPSFLQQVAPGAALSTTVDGKLPRADFHVPHPLEADALLSVSLAKESDGDPKPRSPPVAVGATTSQPTTMVSPQGPTIKTSTESGGPRIPRNHLVQHVLNATSPFRTAVAATASSPTDASARLAERVASVALRAAERPSATALRNWKPKQVPVPPFFHELGTAVANVSDVCSLRNRCGAAMREADRTGLTNRHLRARRRAERQTATSGSNVGELHDDFFAFPLSDDGGTASQAASPGVRNSSVASTLENPTPRAHTRREDRFLERLCHDPRASKVAETAEKRERMARRRAAESERRQLEHARALRSQQASADVALAARGFGSASPESDNALTPGQPASFRQQPQQPLHHSGGRRKSAAASLTQARSPSFMAPGAHRRKSRGVDLAALTPAAADDDVDSVYSTSSSQRSEDERQNPAQYMIYRSGRTSPTNAGYGGGNGSGRRESGGGDSDDEPTGFGGTSATVEESGTRSAAGSFARKSLGGAPSGGGPAKQRLRVKERLLFSNAASLRLSGNPNQLRCEKIRIAVEDDELAKARARVPQVPASKLTPHMRAKVMSFTPLEKKEICRHDDNGRERNELNAKLYECYFGKF